MRDANIAEPSKAVVQSIEFHTDGQVLMTAGMDKRLRFFQVSHLLQLPWQHKLGSGSSSAGNSSVLPELRMMWHAHNRKMAGIRPSTLWLLTFMGAGESPGRHC